MPADAAEIVRLAERVEQATGPDTDLDAEIAHAVGHAQRRGGYLYAWCEAGSTNEIVRPSAYTASLDAAMSLVPEADWEPYGGAVSPYNVVITTAYNSVGVYPTDGNSTGMHDKRGGRSQARSVPLALTAAALRARAAQHDHEVG